MVVSFSSPTATKNISSLILMVNFPTNKFPNYRNILPCYRDPSSQASVSRFIAAGMQVGRSGLTADEFITYTNCNRTDPLEWRYKGTERIMKLKELKGKWDPTGLFSQEFL